MIRVSNYQVVNLMNELYQVARRGAELSEEEARSFEDHLETSPDDLDKRIQLLGYYMDRQFTSRLAADCRTAHICYLVEQHPDCDLLDSPFATIHKDLDPLGFDELRARWVSQSAIHREDVEVLVNAAAFFSGDEFDLAEKIYAQIKRLEPENPRWPQKLSALYQLWSKRPGDAKSKKAFAELTLSMDLDDSDNGHFYKMNDLAALAYDNNDLEQAKSLAERLLELAEQFRDNWNYGNAVHDANCILGRVALKGGDREAAAHYLRKAGQTPGSPQLNSFGPNMLLARELLSESPDAVKEYLRDCGKFWQARTRIERWIKAIEKGEKPALPVR